VIFPFEAPFYQARGVDAEFVGHPLAALPLPTITREEYATKYRLDPAKQWIALLPGSRQSEVHKNLAEMLGMAVRYPRDAEYLIPVASTVHFEQVQYQVDGQLRSWRKVADPAAYLPTVRLVPDARAALFHARASVVASGTATVQALTIGNPFVVIYRVSALTFALAKRLIRYPAEIPAEPDTDGNLPIAMANLVAGRRIVPELLNRRFTAANLEAALRPLLEDTPDRSHMIAALAEARTRLLPKSAEDPIRRVSEAVVQLLQITKTDVPRNTATIV